MSESEYDVQRSGPKLNDFLFILFRHKWKIFLFAAAGIVAAAAYYFLLPPVYESQAKLLVRYVVERSAVDKIDYPAKTPDPQTDNLVNSEVEILTSWDLAMQIAEAIGIERLLPGSGAKGTKADAANSILHGLTVTALKGTDIISVSYQNNDPKLAGPVLQELVNRYFDKHLEVHRSMGAFAFVKGETDQVREQLNQTEEQLKQLRGELGITSLTAGTAALNAELSKDKQDLEAAQAELAEQQARVKTIEKWVAGADRNQAENAAHQPSNKVVREYQGLINRVAYLRQNQTELLSRYTPENIMVKIRQAQIDDLEKQRRDLDEKFPGIAALVSSAGSQNSGPDLLSEKSRLVELEAKTEALGSRLNDIQHRAIRFSELAPQIAELERRKDLEETNYKYLEASLEKAQVDETLDPSRMPNISVVQKPSPAVKVTRDVKKIVLSLAGGGLAIGIGIALLIELVLDRTIKRPLELETRLSIPLLLSVPHFGRNGQLRLRMNNNGDQDLVKGLPESSRHNVSAWDSNHSIRPFCDALRDRLAFYFEINRMTHKPKLVAVTGLSKGAGASTLAAGLAASLSQEGNDKVLLVDEQIDPKRFYDLISQFKTSDFDYVIFDLPFLSNTSPTLAMAGFVDKVLLVVEAEKSSRDAVKRAYEQLAAARARVSVVFNKSRSYGLKWVKGEL